MNQSILIADSDPTFRESLSLLLEAEGYRCRIAEDMSKIKESLLSHPFDLIILDLGLSGGPEFSMLNKIRILNSDIPVFILAPYGDYTEAAKALNHGANRLIVKPVDFEELLEMTRSLRPV